MKHFYRKLQLYTLLMMFWVVINGHIDFIVLFFGTVFSILIVQVTYDIIFGHGEGELSLPSPWRFIWFGLVIFSEIIVAANYHVRRIFKGEISYEVFDVPLDTENIVILTLIANAITLTPGTITLEINGSTLKVIGFANDALDIEIMIKNIQSYQKPFLYKNFK